MRLTAGDLPLDRATQCPYCGKYTVGLRSKQQADELMRKHLSRCWRRPR